MGINVFEPGNVFSDFEQTYKKQFGNYKVTAFALKDIKNEHWCHTNSDNTECPIYGFLVQHKEIEGCLIYITDCAYVKFNFKKLKPSTIILGVDYQDNMLDESANKFEHQITGHMSLETACNFVNANMNECLQNVILGHLSSTNADEEEMLKQIEKVSGCDVFIANKGLSLDLSLPF